MIKRILLIVLLAGCAHADNWPLQNLSWSAPTDSFCWKGFGDGAQIGATAWDRTGATSFSQVRTAVGGRYNQLVIYIYRTGNTRPTAWSFDWDLNSTFASESLWTRDGYWDYYIDSARWRFSTTTGGSYGSTTINDSGKLSAGTYSFDTAFAVANGLYGRLTLAMYSPGRTTANVWEWVRDCTDTASAGVTVSGPAIANSCLLTGEVFNVNGEKMRGVYIQAIPGLGQNLTGWDGTTRYLIATRPMACKTDTAGRFAMYVVGTHEYSDTTQGMYTVTGTYKNTELFKISNMWMPSSGTLNIADSIAARTK